jgi:hypothetical protein
VTLTSAVAIAATACGSAAAQPIGYAAARPVQLAASARPSNPQPARTPGEKIPSGATAATITLDPDINVHVKPPKPVTITNPAEIRRLAALIDGLPPFPLGRYACPFNGNARLVLAFRAAPGGPVRAAATIELEGCEGVDLTIGGVPQPTRGVPDGGRKDAAQALKIAGLNWSLGHYLT